jgi:hypothetical protein
MGIVNASGKVRTQELLKGATRSARFCDDPSNPSMLAPGQQKQYYKFEFPVEANLEEIRLVNNNNPDNCC